MNNAKVYACYNEDENIRKQSSSGGIFSILAEYVLEQEGIVYGVAMSEDCYSAEYIGITHSEDIYRLHGSKYLQAKMGNVFLNVKQNLLNGKKVLFSGTSCQVNGLKSYLLKDYDNLICVDVICHGVPSRKLWEKYVRYQETKNGGKVKSVNFRCKEDSWKKFGIQEIFEKRRLKKIYISKDIDSYMQMFLKDYCLRPSCYNCFAKKNKLADITMADFWGIEDIAPELDDGKGTSLVLIRTDKGEKIFNSLRSKMKLKEVTYEDAIKRNPSEYCSAKRPEEREMFFKNMCDMSFEQLEKIYNSPVKKTMGVLVKEKAKSIVKTYILNKGGGKKSNADYGILFEISKES